jgi:N-formylglutamate amidohydrolase
MALRRSEDAFVDELFAPVVDLGAPLMTARFPRAYLDLNREPYELDSRMFDGRLPPFANTRSMRVAGGLGTIPRIVADGQEIYRCRLQVDEALHRIEWLYKPYHRTLRHLVRRTAQLFGHAILIDCHSMPSSSVSREDGAKADIVLGDRYGTSCAGILIELAEAALRGRGYTVVRNKPYAGGFITEHYGEPALGRHALQIEINRALYMDERSMKKKPAFEVLREDLIQAFAQAISDLESELSTRPIAAE